MSRHLLKLLISILLVGSVFLAWRHVNKNTEAQAANQLSLNGYVIADTQQLVATLW